MSTLDQPILIANSNYHVGHQIAIFVAKERGFFSEEGLNEFEYDSRGLIPGPIEREGLAMAIKNHGVDIAPAVDVEAAIYQRSLGAEVYIVGGWRYTPFLKWYGAKHLTDMSKLRGGRIGMRQVAAKLHLHRQHVGRAGERRVGHRRGAQRFVEREVASGLVPPEKFADLSSGRPGRTS